jgi:predicted murein hydrolase (TIGR00659 family)
VFRSIASGSEAIAPALFWSALTIAFYLTARTIHRRWPCWWLSPLIVAPALVAAAALALHVDYGHYISGTHWLTALLGPATVAFAMPIYEQRDLIRRYWSVFAAGVVAGSTTAVLSAWALATLLGLDGALRLSLLPRSLSGPFAMAVSDKIGGVPDLTALFVILTGVFGSAVGELMLARLPIRSTLARGALMGAGAHAAGAARARQIDRDEGAIAGLIMVLVGVSNVIVASVVPYVLR